MKIYCMIVAALLPPSPALTAKGVDEIAGFVKDTIALSPWHLRMGVRVAETALLFWLLLRVKGFATGKPEADSMRAALRRFEKFGNIPATLIRLYRSLSLLAWEERLEVVKALAA
ncbi:MAG: hypothetical protein HY053_02045 [Proteobacteria bacterium]|nr:hypothetical protein [Pseudomonadota bacterium]